MKNIRYILISLIIGLLFIGCYNIPKDYPTLKIKGDICNFNATVNGVTWIDTSQNVNIRQMGILNTLASKSIISEKVEANSPLTLKLSYSKHLNDFSLYLVKGNSKTNIKLKNNSFKIPSEKGEYIYSVHAYWNDNHSVNYIFKLKVI